MSLMLVKLGENGRARLACATRSGTASQSARFRDWGTARPHQRVDVSSDPAFCLLTQVYSTDTTQPGGGEIESAFLCLELRLTSRPLNALVRSARYTT